MLSFLLREGIGGKYYSDGDADSEEGQISREIAAKFNLQHFNNITANDLTGRWDELCRKMIVQNDGMVSLWQVSDISCQTKGIESLNVLLYGVGGEIGRRFYKHPVFFVGKQGSRAVSRKLSSCLLSNYDGLIKEEAVQLSTSFIKRWTTSALDEGIDPVEIPDYFYAFERVRRWAGSNYKKMTPLFDVFSPFCSRPFVEASFSLSPVYRYSEPLHYAMLSLVPELHQIRFENGTWNSQIPWVNILQIILNKYSIKKKRIKAKITPALDRSLFLKQNLPQIREVCFEQRQSQLWDFINKDKLERVTSNKANEEILISNLAAIYQVATLFYYQKELLQNR
jgi:asparagine synthase (glutamine-hydrolysing)